MLNINAGALTPVLYPHTDTAVNSITEETTPSSQKKRVKNRPCRPALRFYEIVWKYANTTDKDTGERNGSANAYMKWYAKEYKRDRSTIRRWVNELEQFDIAVTSQDESDQMLLIFPKMHIDDVRNMLKFKPKPAEGFVPPVITRSPRKRISKPKDAEPVTHKKVSAPISEPVSNPVSTDYPITTYTYGIQQQNSASETVKEPVPVESEPVVVPEMNNDDKETVHLLVAETIPHEMAKGFVQTIGSKLTRAILQDYRKRRAEGKAQGTGRLIRALQHPEWLNTSPTATKAQRFNPEEPFANPEPSRQVKSKLQQRELEPTPIKPRFGMSPRVTQRMQELADRVATPAQTA